MNSNLELEKPAGLSKISSLLVFMKNSDPRKQKIAWEILHEKPVNLTTETLRNLALSVTESDSARVGDKEFLKKILHSTGYDSPGDQSRVAQTLFCPNHEIPEAEEFLIDEFFSIYKKLDTSKQETLELMIKIQECEKIPPYMEKVLKHLLENFPINTEYLDTYENAIKQHQAELRDPDGLLALLRNRIREQR